MADVCRDWPTDQHTDCCFVVIGCPSHHTILCCTAKNRSHPVGPPSLLAATGVYSFMPLRDWPVCCQEEYLNTSLVLGTSNVLLLLQFELICNTIRLTGLTWTKKLSVISLIQHTKLKPTNANAHLVQYKLKIHEGSPEGIMEERICERDEF